jgi:integrase
LVARYATPSWGKLIAASITRSDVKELLRGIAAPVLANQVLAAISAVFSWAAKEEIVNANPCRGIDRNATRSRERVLSESELPKFWAAFDDAGLIVSSALKTILLTGQRPGEVRCMRREHIVDNCWWEMPGAPVPSRNWPGTKNGEGHRVWLSALVRTLIAELSEDESASGFVFGGSRGGPVHNLDAAMRAISKRLRVERATPHDLRRTFSTKLTSLGFSRDALNRVTNHRDGGIASVYDRFSYVDETKHVMASVASRIMSLVEGQEANNVVPLGRR